MKKRILITILGIAAVIGATAALAYGTNFADPISSTLKKIYPAAFIGLDDISVYDWEQGQMLARKFDPAADKNKIGAEMVRNAEKAQLVRSLKIGFVSDDYLRELNFELADKDEQLQKLLKDYFQDDRQLFEKYVTVPQFYDALLRIKYNSDTNANYNAYVKAKDILDRIKNGKSFEDAAKESSDDKFSGQIGGDLGFVKEDQVLPELMAAVKKEKLGEVSRDIVTTRIGYQIIFPVETADKDGVKLWHVKHILVSTSGYQTWLDTQLRRFLVWRIK